jgi:hypothetical protein
LVRQLAWKGSNGSERSATYRAPSWSWASVDAPIQDFIGLYSDRKGHGSTWQALFEVADVKVELETEDPLGQIKGGYLQLLGKLLQVNVMKVSEGRYGRWQGDDHQVVLIDGCRTTLHFLRDEERNPFITPRILSCLPISVKFSDCYTRITFFESVLLEQTDVDEKYRRVGYLGPCLWHDPSVNDLEKDPVLCALGVHQETPGGRLIVKASASDTKIITIV